MCTELKPHPNEWFWEHDDESVEIHLSDVDAVDYYYSMRMITDQPRCCQLERVACLSVIMFQELRRIPPVNAVCANGVCYSVSFEICHPTNKTPQQWPVFKQGSWCFFIKPPPKVLMNEHSTQSGPPQAVRSGWVRCRREMRALPSAVPARRMNPHGEHAEPMWQLARPDARTG